MVLSHLGALSSFVKSLESDPDPNLMYLKKNYTFCMTTFSLIVFLNSLSFFDVGNSVYSLLSFPS